jgi:hypothetical protein
MGLFPACWRQVASRTVRSAGSLEVEGAAVLGPVESGGVAAVVELSVGAASATRATGGGFVSSHALRVRQDSAV